MRKAFAAALALTAFAGAAFAPAAARELRISNWQPPRSIEARLQESFAKDLAKATNGAVTARVFTGGALLSSGATLSGIRDGVVDAGFIVPTLYAAELRHAVVVQNLLPYQINPFAAAASAIETTVIDCPECQTDYARQNAVYIGGHAGSAWNLMCTHAVNTLAELKGRKVRVTGRSATRMVASIGMTAVNLTPAELAPALQGGQIDCAMGYKAWMIDYSLLDTIRTVIDYSLGSYSGLGLITMNKRSFERLAPAERQALIDLHPEYIARGVENYLKQDQEAIERGKARGIRFVEASPDFVAAIDKFRASDIPNVIADLKATGVKDAEQLVKRHLAMIERWERLMKTEGSDRAGYLRLLQREIYAKAKF